MIKQSDLEMLSTNPSIAESIYNDLMLNRMDAVHMPTRETQTKAFSKICHDLIQQYIIWNDYVHANNIMQLFKDTLLSSDKIKHPSWFIRNEITIYGRRTPLYFIDKPFALFTRMNMVFSRQKETQNTKMIGAVVSLFNYYGNNYLSEKSDKDDKSVFIEHLKNNFLKEYVVADKSLFPKEIIDCIHDFEEYAKHPDDHIKPGEKRTAEYMYEEDDDESAVDNDEICAEQPSQNTPSLDDVTLPATQESSDKSFTYLQGKTIKFIGTMKNSLIKHIQFLAKTNDFTADIVSDYDKITNIDFRKFRYNDKITAIVAGAMPHSIKGMGDYSSGLEMLRSEPGYPPIFECVANEKLKLTKESINRALKEINYMLMSR